MSTSVIKAVAASAKIAAGGVVVGVGVLVTGANHAHGQTYGNCPDPQLVCTTYHENSIATASCGYEACFEMNYGESIRLTVADDEGPFPQNWHVWHTAMVYSASCLLTQSGSSAKTKLGIPGSPSLPRCYLTVQTSEHTYFEHFASNPLTGCLGWVECRAP